MAAPLRALVVGFGRSGAAACRLLVRDGYEVVVIDDKNTVELRIAAKGFSKDRVCVYLSGVKHGNKRLGDYPDKFSSVSSLTEEYMFDTVITSPGVPSSHPALVHSRLQSLQVLGELEFGYRHAKGAIAAITGSNGKTTTTALLGNIFALTGRPSFTCGNIGVPLSEAAPKTTEDALLSVEVSSYQLESIVHFRPHAAVLLNVTPDHLDRHRSFEAYAAAKARLWMNQTADDWLVYNIDDSECVRLADGARSRRVPFSVIKNLDYGAFLSDGRLVVRNPSGEELSVSRDALSLRGVHNAANALAAMTTALLLKVPAGAIEAGIRSFPGVPHRLEKIAEWEGVAWINDSKATNVEAGLVALQAVEAPIILIAGGRGKGSSYTDLRTVVTDKVKTLLLFGEAADRIEADLGDWVVTLRVDDMSEAVAAANYLAQPGDTVLLSPLCASFDMFRDFEERGDVFRREVLALISNQVIK